MKIYVYWNRPQAAAISCPRIQRAKYDGQVQVHKPLMTQNGSRLPTGQSKFGKSILDQCIFTECLWCVTEVMNTKSPSLQECIFWGRTVLSRSPLPLGDLAKWAQHSFLSLYFTIILDTSPGRPHSQMVGERKLFAALQKTNGINPIKGTSIEKAKGGCGKSKQAFPSAVRQRVVFTWLWGLLPSLCGRYSLGWIGSSTACLSVFL